MNGYKIMADSYRKLVKEGKMTEEDAKRDIEILDFLATCTTDDFCRLVDSAAFNDIIKGYVQIAVQNAGIDEKSQNKVVNQLRWIFDEVTAKEALKKYQNG